MKAFYSLLQFIKGQESNLFSLPQLEKKMKHKHSEILKLLKDDIGFASFTWYRIDRKQALL